MVETWKPVKGYEGQYEVSDQGRVRSLARTVNNKKLPDKLMVVHAHYSGYRCVWLRRPREHKKMFVHRLVAEAFLSNAMGKPIVNHKDANRQNNCVENLEWATLSENTRYHYARERGKKAGVVPKDVDDIEWADMAAHALANF